MFFSDLGDWNLFGTWDLVIGISRKMELSKQKNYQQSFDLACASIQGMNLEARAKKAGADYQKGEDGEKITIPFFSEPYHLQFPQIEFYSPSQKVVSLVTLLAKTSA